MSIYQNYHPLITQDAILYVRGNLKGFATEGGETGASGFVSGNQNPGAWSDVPSVLAIAHEFGEATQPGNIRSLDVEVLLDYQGTTVLATGAPIAGIRGSATVAAGTTLGDATAVENVFGVEGKFYLQGTNVLTATGVAAGVKATFDTTSAVAVTSGFNSALHVDMGSASNLNSSAHINAATILNLSGCQIHSVIQVNADASFLFDLNDNTTGHWIVASTGVTTQAKSLKVVVGGTTYYIPLCTGTN